MIEGHEITVSRTNPEAQNCMVVSRKYLQKSNKKKSE